MDHPEERVSYEVAYDRFLESQENEGINKILFELLRKAFDAGYRAAGGTVTRRAAEEE